MLIPRQFRSSQYWEQRYKARGTSGAGSYGRLAEFKAEFLNAFVEKHGLARVLELGCGDGNQLSLATYRNYLGFDVAASAIAMCRRRFTDRNWNFQRYSHRSVVEAGGRFSPDLVISLDVIFHLVEDRVFDDYMASLFSLSPRFVVVYSSDGNFVETAPHVRNREFTNWVARNAPDWRLAARIPNRYPFDPDQPNETSFSDFFVFEPVPAS